MGKEELKREIDRKNVDIEEPQEAASSQKEEPSGTNNAKFKNEFLKLCHQIDSV